MASSNNTSNKPPCKLDSNSNSNRHVYTSNSNSRPNSSRFKTKASRENSRPSKCSVISKRIMPARWGKWGEVMLAGDLEAKDQEGGSRMSLRLTDLFMSVGQWCADMKEMGV